MRHLVDGRKFGRNTSHRNAMFRNMANCVIDQERIVTTVEKAKEVRRVVDRLITLAKGDSVHSRRLAFDRTRDRSIVVKLFADLAPRYAKRPGGYTRILRVDETRWGDGAEMAVLELVDRPISEKKKDAKAGAAKDGAHDKTEKADKKAAKTAKKANIIDAKAKVSAKGLGETKGRTQRSATRKTSARSSSSGSSA